MPNSLDDSLADKVLADATHDSLPMHQNGLRWGQAFMNSIYDRDHVKYKMIMEAGHDCFYDDEKTLGAYNFLKELEKK
jgi:hypothetical protein